MQVLKPSRSDLGVLLFYEFCFLKRNLAVSYILCRFTESELLFQTDFVMSSLDIDLRKRRSSIDE